jgi:hypothetical protein
MLTFLMGMTAGAVVFTAVVYFGTKEVRKGNAEKTATQEYWEWRVGNRLGVLEDTVELVRRRTDNVLEYVDASFEHHLVQRHAPKPEKPDKKKK